MSPEVPAPWRPLFEKCGFESGRQLSAAMGVAVETGARLLRGDGVSSATITKAATALRTSEKKIRQLRGEQERQPFTLPPDADRLTPKQREAVRAVVLAMLDDGAGSANGGRFEPTAGADVVYLAQSSDDVAIEVMESTIGHEDRAADTQLNRGRAHRAELDRQAELLPVPPDGEDPA